MQSPYCSISVVEFKIEQNHIPMPIMRLWFFFSLSKVYREAKSDGRKKIAKRSTVLDRRQINSQKFTNVKRYFIDFVVENTSRSQDINTVVADFSLPVMTRSGVFWQCVPTVTHGRQSPSRKETRFNGGQNLRAVHDQKKKRTTRWHGHCEDFSVFFQYQGWNPYMWMLQLGMFGFFKTSFLCIFCVLNVSLIYTY